MRRARRWLLRRPAGDLSDRELVEEAQAGSARAREEIARRHWDELFRIAFLILRDKQAAEDVAQEAVLSGLGALERFDSSRPLRPWLARIATNKAISVTRYRARRPEAELAVEPAAQTPDEVESTVTEEIKTALSRLEPQARALVILRYALDYRATEIAEMLEMPPATVRTKLKRALDRMRIDLEEVSDGD